MARILLVDDEPIIHDIIGRFLRRYEHVVVSAEDGVVALEVLQAQAADLVIADIRMPRMDGLQLLAEINERWPGMPVIIVTGHGDDKMEAEARRLGAVGFKAKPLGLSDLTDLINEHLP